VSALGRPARGGGRGARRPPPSSTPPIHLASHAAHCDRPSTKQKTTTGTPPHAHAMVVGGGWCAAASAACAAHSLPKPQTRAHGLPRGRAAGGHAWSATEVGREAGGGRPAPKKPTRARTPFFQALGYAYGPLPPSGDPSVAAWTPPGSETGGLEGSRALVSAYGACALVAAGRADLASAALTRVADALLRGGAVCGRENGARAARGGLGSARASPRPSTPLGHALRLAFAMQAAARALGGDPALVGRACDVAALVASVAAAWGAAPAPPPSPGRLDAFELAVVARLLIRAPGARRVETLAALAAAADASVDRRLRQRRPLACRGAAEAGVALWIAGWASALALPWAPRLAGDAGDALSSLWRAGAFAGPARTRVARHEFGAAVGVQAAGGAVAAAWRPRLAALARFWAAPGRLAAGDALTPLLLACSLRPGPLVPRRGAGVVGA